MERPEKRARLPVQQLAVLAIARFAEPVALTSVYPYIPEMVASFNVPTDQIGVYSGWLAAVFSMSQALTGVVWGRASDKLGRKPMILLALTFTMISTLLFGFSTSLTWAFLTRSMQGASSGNIGIVRTAVAEMVPQKELQPRAFSIMPLVWNIGSIFGPSIGGFLSNPQRRGWLTGSDLLKKFPYALPNLMTGVLFLIGIVSAILFLKESHAEKKARKDPGLLLGNLLTQSCSRRKDRHWKRNEDEAEPFLDENGSPMSSPVTLKSSKIPVKPAVQPTWGQVFSRQSVINLIAYTGLAMHSMAFDQLMPVFMHHPLQKHNTQDRDHPLRFSGGFGLDSGRIGVLFTAYGVFGMLVQFLFFPPVARRFGILNCLKVCAIILPIVYAAVPFTSLLSTMELKQGVCLALMLVKCAAVIFAFPCSTILLTNSARSLGVLGMLNGIATSISAAGRAAGPALMGWAFTLGVDLGYVVIPFWTLSVVTILSAFPVWWLVELEGFGAKSNHEEEHELEAGDPSDEQQRLHDPEFDTDIVRRTSDLSIPADTEDANLLNGNTLSVTTSRDQRPLHTIHRTNSTYSLQKIASPIGHEPSNIASGLVRRNSTGAGSMKLGPEQDNMHNR